MVIFNGFVIKDHDSALLPDHDILVADEVTAGYNTTHGTYEGVPTIFRHKLSYLHCFTLKTFENYGEDFNKVGDKKFTLHEIKLTNVKHKGTLSVTSPSETNLGSWDLENSTTDYTWYSDTDGVEISKLLPK